MCLVGLCLSLYSFILSSPTVIYLILTQTALIVHCLTQKGGNWSSKLFVSLCSVRQAAHLLHGYCVCEEVSRLSLLHSKSSGAVMRLFLAFVIFVCGVGFIGCKLSSKCPSGQFMSKNQCVLCHPTCSECNGHELFECTTCGVGESFLPVLSA